MTGSIRLELHNSFLRRPSPVGRMHEYNMMPESGPWLWRRSPTARFANGAHVARCSYWRTRPAANLHFLPERSFRRAVRSKNQPDGLGTHVGHAYSLRKSMRSIPSPILRDECFAGAVHNHICLHGSPCRKHCRGRGRSEICPTFVYPIDLYKSKFTR